MAARRTALTQARVEKGYEVKDLAAKLGVSRSFLYKIEEGVRDPSIPLMGAIARELDRTVDALFFASEPDELSREVAGS